MGKARQANLHLHLHFSFTHSLLKLYSWAPGRNTSNKVKLEKKDKSELVQTRDKQSEFVGEYEVMGAYADSKTAFYLPQK